MRMVECLMIDVSHDGYSPDWCGNTMTIGELIDNLERIGRQYSFDYPVFFRHDGGYTYGALVENDMFECTEYEEEGMDDDEECEDDE